MNGGNNRGEDGIGYEDSEGHVEDLHELEALRKLRGERTQDEFAKVWPDAATALAKLEASADSR